jgi:hypothetical protein
VHVTEALTEQDALVPVYVPQRLLPEVHALLAKHWAPASTISTLLTKEELRLREWSVDRLRRASARRGPAFDWLAKRLAGGPGHWISFQQLVEEYANHSNDTSANGRLKGVLSGLTKDGKTDGVETWPFELRTDRAGLFSYSVSPEMAERIFLALGR